jgi:hypothetical protein
MTGTVPLPLLEERSAKINLGQGRFLFHIALLYGPAHGHQIAKHIQRTTADVLQVEHGSLYPALHRLERKGWIAAKWEPASKETKAIMPPTAPLGTQRQSRRKFARCGVGAR